MNENYFSLMARITQMKAPKGRKHQHRAKPYEIENREQQEAPSGRNINSPGFQPREKEGENVSGRGRMLAKGRMFLRPERNETRKGVSQFVTPDN